MDLVCEKHRETMDSAGAYCRHPSDYCKFRTACLIHFLSKENRPQRDGEFADSPAVPAEDAP